MAATLRPRHPPTPSLYFLIPLFLPIEPATATKSRRLSNRVGCCVLYIASPHLSLYFSIPLFLPSPAIEPTTATKSRWLAACTWHMGERRRRDWMAPLLYPRRERREKPMGVGWRQLELVVVWVNIILRFFCGLIQVLVATCDDPHSNHIFLDLFWLFAWTYFHPLHVVRKLLERNSNRAKKSK